jgi:hypothetical protein
MSGFLPAPSMIVVFSFSMRTRFARPSMSSVTFSSLMTSSSEIVWPAVRIAALDVFRDDQERHCRLHHRLEVFWEAENDESCPNQLISLSALALEPRTLPNRVQEASEQLFRKISVHGEIGEPNRR